MKAPMTPEEYLKRGNLSAALEALQNQVRKQPDDPKLRIFLFQLLAVLGQWDRALTQLNVAGDLDDGALAMVIMYREVLNSEAFREQVFQGQRDPVIFGEPRQWIALLLQALKLTATGDDEQTGTIRASAYEQAPAVSGKIDGDAFEWISDGDSRLGPVLELIIEGRYLWAPYDQIQAITLEPPEDLRDCVWMPAHLQWSNGGESYGVIPTRYPDSQRQEDTLLALSRKTVWEKRGEDAYIGLGQRMLMTDQGEYPLMDARSIEFDASISTDSPESG